MRFFGFSIGTQFHTVYDGSTVPAAAARSTRDVECLILLSSWRTQHYRQDDDYIGICIALEGHFQSRV